MVTNLWDLKNLFKERPIRWVYVFGMIYNDLFCYIFSSTTTETSTTAMPTTPSTQKPVTSTATPDPSGRSGSKFDGWSFFGGILLTVGVSSIAFISFKYYKVRSGGQGGGANYNRFWIWNSRQFIIEILSFETFHPKVAIFRHYCDLQKKYLIWCIIWPNNFFVSVEKIKNFSLILSLQTSYFHANSHLSSNAHHHWY